MFRAGDVLENPVTGERGEVPAAVAHDRWNADSGPARLLGYRTTCIEYRQRMLNNRREGPTS